MPLYEYRCAYCGPFEQHRRFDQANLPLECPGCHAPAARAFTVSADRTPRGPLAHANTTDRSRADRSRTGEPTIGPRPTGQRLPTRRHQH